MYLFCFNFYFKFVLEKKITVVVQFFAKFFPVSDESHKFSSQRCQAVALVNWQHLIINFSQYTCAVHFVCVCVCVCVVCVFAVCPLMCRRASQEAETLHLHLQFMQLCIFLKLKNPIMLLIKGQGHFRVNF